MGDLKRIMAEPGLEVTPLLSWRAHASPDDTALFRAIASLANERGATVVPSVTTGFTDCNAFRAQGITCYGFLPIRFDPRDFERIHGADERLSIERAAAAIVELHTLLQHVSPSQ